MNNTPDSPAKPPDDRMDQGGNYWTLFTPGIWKVLHAVLQHIAKAFYVIAPLRKVPACRIGSSAAAVASMIVVDDLRDIAEGGKRRFEPSVVEPGTPMQQEEGRLFAHSISIGDQTGVLHIDVKFGTVHVYKHDLDTLVVMDLA